MFWYLSFDFRVFFGSVKKIELIFCWCGLFFQSFYFISTLRLCHSFKTKVSLIKKKTSLSFSNIFVSLFIVRILMYLELILYSLNYISNTFFQVISFLFQQYLVYLSFYHHCFQMSLLVEAIRTHQIVQMIPYIFLSTVKFGWDHMCSCVWRAVTNYSGFLFWIGGHWKLMCHTHPIFLPSCQLNCHMLQKF